MPSLVHRLRDPVKVPSLKLHSLTVVVLHSESSTQMAPARRAALPRKLLDNASRADSHTPAERFVLEQKVPKAAASWFLSVRAMVCVFLTKGLKSCKQRLQDLQGVSTHPPMILHVSRPCEHVHRDVCCDLVHMVSVSFTVQSSLESQVPVGSTN